MKATGKLLNRYADQLPLGKVIWIGVRPNHKEPMQPLTQVNTIQDYGLEGDHRCQKTAGSARQVTLISQEFIEQIEHYLPQATHITPEMLRRNIVVSGINLNAVRHQYLKIGEAVFLTTAHCHPCSRMESTLGKGAIPAMFGHGGLCAKIVHSGAILLNDSVQVLREFDHTKT